MAALAVWISGLLGRPARTEGSVERPITKSGSIRPVRFHPNPRLEQDRSQTAKTASRPGADIRMSPPQARLEAELESRSKFRCPQTRSGPFGQGRKPAVWPQRARPHELGHRGSYLRPASAQTPGAHRIRKPPAWPETSWIQRDHCILTGP